MVSVNLVEPDVALVETVFIVNGMELLSVVRVAVRIVVWIAVAVDETRLTEDSSRTIHGILRKFRVQWKK